MSDKQRKALRSMPQVELEQRYQRAFDRKQIRMKWRYYFELTLRKLEEGRAS